MAGATSSTRASRRLARDRLGRVTHGTELVEAANGELTKIEDVVPIGKFLTTDGWWITGQTNFADGGYTTR